MLIKDLLENEEFTLINEGCNLDKEIESGYISDLLSWVMSHAKAGCAWMTIQTHVNVVAVATLLDIACIIIPEGEGVEEDTIKKATEEDLPLISTKLNSFEIAGVLIASGVK